MSGFDRRLWRVKPPPGTRLVGGHFAPNILACPMNEFGGLQIFNYVDKSYAPPIGIVNGSSTTKTDRRDGRYHSHLATTSQVSFSLSNNADFLPNGANANITIILGYRKRDTTFRNAAALAAPPSNGLQYRCEASIPYGDGNVYWDFENISAGRAVYSGATFADDIWVFTVGARGNEIWQNGTRRTLGTYTGGRTSNPGGGWFLGGGGGTAGSDIADYNFVYMWDYQLPIPLIKDLSINPWSIWTPFKSQLVGFSNFTTTDQTLTAQADIKKTTDQSLSAQSDIRKTTDKTLSAQSYIVHQSQQSLTAQADIKKTTDKILNAQANIVSGSTPKTLNAQADIQNVTNRILNAQADIKKTTDKTLSAQSYIVHQTQQTLSAQANLKTQTQKTLSAQSDIRNVTNKTLNAQADIKIQTQKTLSAQANLIQNVVLFGIQPPSVIFGSTTDITITISGYPFSNTSQAFFEQEGFAPVALTTTFISNSTITAVIPHAIFNRIVGLASISVTA